MTHVATTNRRAPPPTSTAPGGHIYISDAGAHLARKDGICEVDSRNEDVGEHVGKVIGVAASSPPLTSALVQGRAGAELGYVVVTDSDSRDAHRRYRRPNSTRATAHDSAFPQVTVAFPPARLRWLLVRLEAALPPH